MNYKPLRWRSLVGCSPRGREESDIIEHLHFHFSLSCIGEGNGNPLQCSCLENPRDGGAWWAAIYGVAQSRIGLKWLSSSGSSSSSSRQNKYFLKSGFRVCLWSSTFTLPPLVSCIEPGLASRFIYDISPPVYNCQLLKGIECQNKAPHKMKHS